jgi:Pao retrotransposon peptidase
MLQEILSFSNASEEGFGVCIYLRKVYGPVDIDVRLIIGMARVAPLRLLSIPRFELQGALMASRLTDTVRVELNWKGSITFWCDSQTTMDSFIFVPISCVRSSSHH